MCLPGVSLGVSKQFQPQPAQSPRPTVPTPILECTPPNGRVPAVGTLTTEIGRELLLEIIVEHVQKRARLLNLTLVSHGRVCDPATIDIQ